jgi:hypothetical protein
MTLRSAPHQHQWNFFSGGGGYIVKRSIISPFQAIISTFRLFKKKSQILQTFFCDLHLREKCQNPRPGQPILGERKEKKENNHKIVDTLFWINFAFQILIAILIGLLYYSPVPAFVGREQEATNLNLGLIG